jgi:PIN domain nuclease of toxin-antitoxin system
LTKPPLPTKLLLDTHILIRMLMETRKLSREQFRLLTAAMRRAEPVALSAVTLIEIVALRNADQLKLSVDDISASIQSNPLFQVIPISFDITSEMAAIGGSLRDPFDWAIVATARVHGLRLVTSDERIIDSKLVEVVD